MISHPILCPIDFSENSRGALRYAGAIAAHFGARLTLLTVSYPLWQDAEVIGGLPRLAEDTQRALERFFGQTLGERPHGIPEVRFEVAIGRPAAAVVSLSQTESADLIVMSSHGQSGLLKTVFGSTTERVLRETTVPVLIIPNRDAGPETVEAAHATVKRVLVPVDFTTATSPQVDIASGLAAALGVPLMLLHVVEPLRFARFTHSLGPDAERRERADADLKALVNTVSAASKAEAIIATGDAAVQIAKVAADRDAGIIVMGLHSSPFPGPRMGTVTYRVLCHAHRLVLALPPVRAAHASVDTETRRRTAGAPASI